MFRVRKKRKKQVLQVPQLRDQTKKGVRAHLAETTTVWGVLRIHESLSARSLSHTPHKHTPERSLFLSLALLQTTARGGYMIFFSCRVDVYMCASLGTFVCAGMLSRILRILHKLRTRRSAKIQRSAKEIFLKYIFGRKHFMLRYERINKIRPQPKKFTSTHTHSHTKDGATENERV